MTGDRAVLFRKLTYNIEISNIEQPFINCPDVAVVGDPGRI